VPTAIAPSQKHRDLQSTQFYLSFFFSLRPGVVPGRVLARAFGIQLAVATLDTPERIATQGAAPSPQWALAIRVIGDFVKGP
jgi:hypothetical protein